VYTLSLSVVLEEESAVIMNLPRAVSTVSLAGAVSTLSLAGAVFTLSLAAAVSTLSLGRNFRRLVWLAGLSKQCFHALKFQSELLRASLQLVTAVPVWLWL
jgi:hypothetical protein